MAVYYDGISLQNQRKVNMDSLLLKRRTLDGQELYLAAVCDGVGSLEQGALAASLATKMLSVWFDDLMDTNRLGLRLRDHVLDIHKRVGESARTYQVHTASTLSALLLDRVHYYIVHVGDSRIYCARAGRIEQLTQDQVSCGSLTSYIGHEKPPSIFYNEGILLGELFLLCTDGLYKRMEDMVLQAELMKVEKKHLRKTIEHLVGYAIDKGERDNISLAIILNER